MFEIQRNFFDTISIEWMKSKKIYEFKNYHNTTVAMKLAKITPTKTTHTITPAKYLNNTSVMMENTKKQKNYPRQFC